MRARVVLGGVAVAALAGWATYSGLSSTASTEMEMEDVASGPALQRTRDLASTPDTQPSETTPSTQTARATQSVPPTRATMRRVFAALQVLLPGALGGGLEKGQTSRETFAAAVDRLAEAATELEAHASQENAPFLLMSHSLAIDARAIQASVERGRFVDAGHRIVRMTRTCVACHARQPSDNQAPLAAHLVSSIDTRSLDPLQIAVFELATRQFDSALDRYESIFADPSTPLAAIDYGGALTEYLIVALRVRSSPERARRTLDRLSEREGLTPALARNLRSWASALDALGPELSKPPALERIHAILMAGSELERRPSDRADLIHRIVASALLYGWIERAGPRDASTADALLLLAETDAFIRRAFARSEAQFYLERAIRLAPGTEVARTAYERLEGRILASYRGFPGVHPPPDVEQMLAELRALAHPNEVGSTSG